MKNIYVVWSPSTEIICNYLRKLFDGDDLYVLLRGYEPFIKNVDKLRFNIHPKNINRISEKNISLEKAYLYAKTKVAKKKALGFGSGKFRLFAGHIHNYFLKKFYDDRRCKEFVLISDGSLSYRIDKKNEHKKFGGEKLAWCAGFEGEFESAKNRIGVPFDVPSKLVGEKNCNKAILPLHKECTKKDVKKIAKKVVIQRINKKIVVKPHPADKKEWPSRVTVEGVNMPVDSSIFVEAFVSNCETTVLNLFSSLGYYGQFGEGRVISLADVVDSNSVDKQSAKMIKEFMKSHANSESKLQIIKSEGKVQIS